MSLGGGFYIKTYVVLRFEDHSQHLSFLNLKLQGRPRSSSLLLKMRTHAFLVTAALFGSFDYPRDTLCHAK